MLWTLDMNRLYISTILLFTYGYADEPVDVQPRPAPYYSPFPNAQPHHKPMQVPEESNEYAPEPESPSSYLPPSQDLNEEEPYEDFSQENQTGDLQNEDEE